MQIVKISLLLSCILLLGSNVNGITLDGILDCAQVAADSIIELASHGIPELKAVMTCTKFVPPHITDLDLEALIKLTFDFVKKVFENDKCLDEFLERAHAAEKTVLENLANKKCLPKLDNIDEYL